MIAIDANIFLELELQQERYDECKKFLESVREGRIRAVLSEFTISAIALVMERNGKNAREIRIFLLSLLLYKGLSFVQATIEDKIEATFLMGQNQLDLEDALTLQCALANNCSALVSFDKDFNSVKEIKRITPAEALRE